MNKQDDTKHYLKLLVKTSFFAFLTILLSKSLSYGYKIVIARGFGAEIYGLFSLAVIIAGIFTTASALGFSDGLIRYIPFYRGSKNLAKAKYIVKKAIIISIISSVLLYSILFLLSDQLATYVFKEPSLAYYLKIIGLSIPFIVVSSIFLSIIRSFERVTLYSFLSNAFQNGTKLLILLLFILIGFKNESLVYSYLLTFVFLALASYFFSRKERYLLQSQKDISKKEKRETYREFLSYSWPFIFTGLIYSIFYSTDSLILGYFTNAENVGFYNAAVTIVTLFFIAPDLFMQLFLPLISSKLSQNKKTLIKDLTKQVSKWIYLINLPLFALILLFPGVIINILFGAKFLIAENTLRILVIGALFSGFLSLLTGLISMRGESKTILKGFLIFTVLNAILNLILVPRYGLEGAATATTIVWILFSITLLIQVRNRFKFTPFKPALIKITLITLLPVIVLSIVKEFIVINFLTLIITGIIFGLIYIFLIIITGCLDKNDLMIVNAVRSKLATQVLKFKSSEQ